ncbi:MAG TPA: hypothetical protein VFG23_19415, partial [Polyangia bacterium]|nr:hypothetical protein [Polyangia bacterium]
PWSGAAFAARAAMLERLRQSRITLTAGATPFDSPGGEVADLTLERGLRARRQLRTGTLSLQAVPVAGARDAIDLTATFRARAGAPDGVGLALRFDDWSRDNYLLLPGACYAGNRFASRFVGYPPLLTEPADIGPHVPPIVSDIPRLNVHAGPSRLEIALDDLATPAAAIYLPASGLGIILLVDLTSSPARTGLAVFENDERTRAGLVVGAPFAAAGQRSSDKPSGDTPPEPRLPPRPTARPGQPMALRARLFAFDCRNVGQLCERLFAARKSLSGPTARVNRLPFSAAFAAHEARVNRRWVERPGFLAIGARDSAYMTWQSGWCGGLAGTLPLLGAGDARSQARALRTIAFALDGGQSPAGLFHGVSDGTTWFDDGFTAPLPPPPAATAPAPAYNHPRWHLIRRSADTLAFLLKQLALLDRRRSGAPAAEAGPAVDPGWSKAARLGADALTRLWDRHHQLGQFVDVESGELIVGGSTSAGLAPAALALAADYFKEPRYLQTARAVAEHYFDRYVQIGLTCGGPGDALQCPDSESAAALLESFVTLFEVTRERIWVDRARAAGHLLASWVISYDAGATRGRPGALRTSGAVLTDAQSRTGLPGYVLASGDALLRLYRATGEVAWLDLLRDTIHNLGQYLARPEAPADAPTRPSSPAPNPPHPRVDTGAWLDADGGVVPVDGLYDAIGLLAYTEVPGVYAQPSTGFVYAFDHVEARLEDRLTDRLIVALHNPTPVEATVRLFSEPAADTSEPLPAGAILAAPSAVVPPGATIEVAMPPMAAGR